MNRYAGFTCIIPTLLRKCNDDLRRTHKTRPFCGVRFVFFTLSCRAAGVHRVRYPVGRQPVKIPALRSNHIGAALCILQQA